MVEWIQKKLPLKKMKIQETNPRVLSKHDAESLSESITQFGLCEPLVVNSDMTIIGGHQRYRTLKKLGYKDAPVYMPSEKLDDEQVRELTIRLNRNHGEWNFDMLADRYDVDELLEWGMTEEDLDIQLQVEEDKQSEKPSQIIISFCDQEHIQDAETKISEILTAYQGATYRIKK